MVPEQTSWDKERPPVRTFIAVSPPAPLCDDVAKTVRGLRRPAGAGRMSVDGARWVPAENLHYTVKFLGDLSETRLPDMVAALEESVSSLAPFDATLAGVGCFPGTRRPRILWVGMGEGAPELTALAAQVEAAVAPLGWEPERRGFTPHLTVGRVKRPTPRSDASDWVHVLRDHGFGTFRLEELILFQSTLRPQGPLYTPLERIRLDGGGGA